MVAWVTHGESVPIPPKTEKKDSDEDYSSSEISTDENPERGNWAGKLDFLLSCLSYAVGLGNLWRFPYLCYRNGGGAFLIPYVIMLVFTGIPLFFMELSFGQYASQGVISIWTICPIMQGIGWGMLFVSIFIGIYYNMIIAWTFFYLTASFNKDVPWKNCENDWNTPECGMYDSMETKNCTWHNGTYYNHTCYTVASVGGEMFSRMQNLSQAELLDPNRRTPSDEYFHNYVLDISEGFHEMGEVRWQLVLCLMLAWIVVGICLIKGIKSSGKAVYFTAIFPYLVLCILLVRGLTLPGSVDGIVYYLTPQWHRLTQAKVWGDAAVQIFFSLSPCWGGLITLASYNKFNNNCLRDAIVVSIGNCATSVFAGFVIFAIIGFMSHELGVPIDKVARDGAGLAFIVYPEVVTRLPISPLWAVMFFLMLITLGLGTQFATVTTIHTTLLDAFPNKLRKGKRQMMLMGVICTGGFLLGLSCCTRGGMYMLQLMDSYAGTYSVLVLGFAECVAISYIYGVENFLGDIKCMIGRHPGRWWKIMWRYVTPVLLIFIMLFTWIDFKPTSYGGYVFPIWADVMGWMISFTSVIPIPIVAIYKIYTADSNLSLIEKIRHLIKPAPEWGPALDKNRKPTSCIEMLEESQVPLQAVNSPVQSPDKDRSGQVTIQIDTV